MNKWRLNIEEFREYIDEYLVEQEGFNCIMGVSGGKDSTRQAIFARDILGLKPLLVSQVFPPQLQTVTGAKNLGNLSRLGFDTEIVSLAPLDWRRLMKYAFINYGNPLIPTESALYTSVPKKAIDYGIKLILWGDNPALQLGDLGTLGLDPYDGNNISKTNTLRNNGVSWIKDLDPPVINTEGYFYPGRDLYLEKQLKTVYMGTVMKDWSLLNNNVYAVVRGVDNRQERPALIGDIFGVTAVDQQITPVNQVIKYLKYGFGRMTDYANELIRQDKMSRDMAVKLIKRYDGKLSKGYFKHLCKYLEMTYEEFWEVIDGFVDKNLFVRIAIDEYRPLFNVGVDS